MKAQNRKGFTLIEVVAATAIAIPMLIILMQIVPSMLKSGTQSQVATYDTFLADSKVEQIRTQLNSTAPGYGYSHNYTQAATAFPAPNQLYKFTVADNMGAKEKFLEVTVWNDIDGGGTINGSEYPVVLDTIFAKRN